MRVTARTSRVTRSLRRSLPRTPASGPRTTSTSMPSVRNGWGSYCSVVFARRWIASISASGTGSGRPLVPTRSATPTTLSTLGGDADIKETNQQDYIPDTGNNPRHIKTDFPGGKMTRTPFEAGQFLEWLGEVLRAAKDVDVDVVVVGQPEDARSSVQIT